MSKRKPYLDYAKGIGILFIMLAHCIQYFQEMSTLNKFVCSFHVPIFFVASGFLAWEKRERKYHFADWLRKKAKALLIPYVVYSLLNSSLKLGILLLKQSLTTEELRSELTALFITGNGTVWFLLTLFFIEILFWLFQNYIRTAYELAAILFLVLPYQINALNHNPVGVVLIRVIGGFGFFLTGYCACKWTERCILKKSGLISAIAIIFGVTSYLFFGSNYSFFSGKFDKPMMSLLTGVCLSCAIVLTCHCLEENLKRIKLGKLLDYYGKNSLVIMLIHPTILLLFTYPFASAFASLTGAASVFGALLLWGTIMILVFPASQLVNRWFSWTIGKKK